MVGVGRGNHRGVGTQVVEGAVELVGFDDNEVALGRENVVRAVVFRDAAQESVAIHCALVQQVRRDGRSRRLAVRSRHAKPFLRLCDCTEHLCAFLDLESALAKPLQFAVVSRDGRCINHECAFGVATGCGNEFRIVFKVECDPFLFECVGQVRTGTIVAGHEAAELFEIAFESAHADAAGTEEENGGILHCNQLRR